MNFKIYNMDVFDGLKAMQNNNEMVDCVMTSPPYWGLRDYGIEGQLGLESHPKEYIENLVKVFRETKKVLKDSGSLWLNLGDTYFGSGGAGGDYNDGGLKEGQPKYKQGQISKYPDKKYASRGRSKELTGSVSDGSNWLKNKQKMLMPHRVAIDLQDDGWILRNDIVWHKPSHMPSSVQDRLTNSFEYLFHFVKQKKYYYDLDSIREPHKVSSIERNSKGYNISPMKGRYKMPNEKRDGTLDQSFLNPRGKNPADFWNYDSKYNKDSYGQTLQGFQRGKTIESDRKESRENAKKLFPDDLKKQQEYINFVQDHSGNPLGKNPADVWSLTTEGFSEAHFACFPTKLVRKPLKATCPGDGIVLDLFVGSGTTLLEAQNQGKSGIGIELNPDYIKLIKKHLNGDEHQKSLNPNRIEVVSLLKQSDKDVEK